MARGVDRYRVKMWKRDRHTQLPLYRPARSLISDQWERPGSESNVDLLFFFHTYFPLSLYLLSGVLSLKLKAKLKLHRSCRPPGSALWSLVSVCTVPPHFSTRKHLRTPINPPPTLISLSFWLGLLSISFFGSKSLLSLIPSLSLDTQRESWSVKKMKQDWTDVTQSTKHVNLLKGWWYYSTSSSPVFTS